MTVISVFRLTIPIALLATLTACNSLNNASGKIAGLVSPYKVEVVQGNFVSKEQREALQIGMARVQVKDILGSPLVASVFHADRWDYVFTIRRQGQEPQQRKLSVFFKGDELTRVEHDELISEQEFVDSLSQGRKFGKPPVLDVPAGQLPPAASPNTTGAVSGAPSANPTGRVYPPLESPAR